MILFIAKKVRTFPKVSNFFLLVDDRPFYIVNVCFAFTQVVLNDNTDTSCGDY
jgi:hypothetical protein